MKEKISSMLSPKPLELRREVSVELLGADVDARRAHQRKVGHVARNSGFFLRDRRGLHRRVGDNGIDEPDAVAHCLEILSDLFRGDVVHC